jgi:hypothetical protein
MYTLYTSTSSNPEANYAIISPLFNYNFSHFYANKRTLDRCNPKWKEFRHFLRYFNEMQENNSSISYPYPCSSHRPQDSYPKILHIIDWVCVKSRGVCTKWKKSWGWSELIFQKIKCIHGIWRSIFRVILMWGLTANSMEPSSCWEAISRSATPVLPNILWNPKVPGSQKPSTRLSSVPDESSPYHLHLIPLRSTLISSHLCQGPHSGLVPYGFPTKSYNHSSSSHACYMACLSHPPWLNFNYTWRAVQIMKLLILQFSPASHYSVPLWPKHSPQQFSNTSSLYSSLNFRKHVSRPYKTAGKIIVLYILIFYIFRLETISQSGHEVNGSKQYPNLTFC